MIPCSYCQRSFNSISSLRQHEAAKHLGPSPSTAPGRYVCGYCDRTFGSKNALNNHKSSNHRYEPDVYDGLPFPGAEGYWVYREDYPWGKGFGVFICNCGSKSRKNPRVWMSAHAFAKRFRQGCQNCESLIFPKIMWVSTTFRERAERDVNDTPHDASRCEACLAGDYCTTSRVEEAHFGTLYVPIPLLHSPSQASLPLPGSSIQSKSLVPTSSLLDSTHHSTPFPERGSEQRDASILEISSPRSGVAKLRSRSDQHTFSGETEMHHNVPNSVEARASRHGSLANRDYFPLNTQAEDHMEIAAQLSSRSPTMSYKYLVYLLVWILVMSSLVLNLIYHAA